MWDGPETSPSCLYSEDHEQAMSTRQCQFLPTAPMGGPQERKSHCKSIGLLNSWSTLQEQWLKSKASWSKKQRQRIVHGHKSTCKVPVWGVPPNSTGYALRGELIWELASKNAIKLQSKLRKGLGSLLQLLTLLFNKLAAAFKDEHQIRSSIEHVFKKIFDEKGITCIMDQHYITWFGHISE